MGRGCACGLARWLLFTVPSWGAGSRLSFHHVRKGFYCSGIGARYCLLRAGRHLADGAVLVRGSASSTTCLYCLGVSWLAVSEAVRITVAAGHWLCVFLLATGRIGHSVTQLPHSVPLPVPQVRGLGCCYCAPRTLTFIDLFTFQDCDVSSRLCAGCAYARGASRF